ncbi:MAG: hypothetical protein RL272_1022, partial [Candidatus Parcubacteria bacterium]
LWFGDVTIADVDAIIDLLQRSTP